MLSLAEQAFGIDADFLQEARSGSGPTLGASAMPPASVCRAVFGFGVFFPSAFWYPRLQAEIVLVSSA